VQTDVKVVSVETFKVPVPCRTPLKFGAVVVDSGTIGYARATVENRAGRRATGWGAMFIMNLWAWPGPPGSHVPRGRAMADLLDAYARAVAGWGRFGHPIEIFMETEGELRRLAAGISRRIAGEEMPLLAALVAASPVDHAVHDAYGNASGVDSYRACGPDFMGPDLSRWLGGAYKGVYPSQFLRQDYAPRVAVFHLVGGLDVLRERDAPADAPQDGVPNSLEKWIERDGVFCLKVKLRGRDLEWDVARTLEVSRIYHEVRSAARTDLPHDPFLTADTNEQCESPGYIVEYLEKIRERAPGVFREILYIEQPTERDLAAHRFDMRPIAGLKPVLIDESLTGPEDFRLAMELGWSGIALKSCKCLSSDLLLVPMAELAGVPYAVQDLTNPSIALILSVGLAARTHTILGVEANSRQFFPKANEAAARLHPALYEIRDGYAYTASLGRTGLGLRMDEIDLAACGLPAQAT